MADILEDTNNIITSNKVSVENVLTYIKDFNDIVDENYILNEVKDVDYLKSLMKKKIELGIRDYDSK